jgi:starch-binding outer membrane protein, SusD/RagB family
MNNTRLYKIIAGLILLISFSTGCKKYTEVEPESGYTIPEVFTDVPNATMAVIGVYDELQGDNGYGITAMAFVSACITPTIPMKAL